MAEQQDTKPRKCMPSPKLDKDAFRCIGYWQPYAGTSSIELTASRKARA